VTHWYRAAAPDEMADGAVKRVVAGASVIALARHGDAYFALDNRCPHAGGPLSEGTIENGLLMCPWHGREYELGNGRCDAYEGVATYPVEVRDDGIFVSA
jgi:nitrite reductase/ring-hydroxylating ferredoxin subunit